MFLIGEFSQSNFLHAQFDTQMLFRTREPESLLFIQILGIYSLENYLSSLLDKFEERNLIHCHLK